MNKVFEILNTQPNITKTKIFKIDLIFKNSAIKKIIKIAINCFDNKQVKQLSVLNNKRTKEISLSISSMPKYQENIIIIIWLIKTSIVGLLIPEVLILVTKSSLLWLLLEILICSRP